MEGLGYSAAVDLQLHCNGETISVAQTRHDRLILTEAKELSAGPAELSIIIDGKATKYSIALEATQGPSKFVAYR
jgi:hypothetical protein